MVVWVVQRHYSYEGSDLRDIFLNRQDAEAYVVNEMNPDYYMDMAIDETSTTYYLKYGDSYTVEKHEVK